MGLKPSPQPQSMEELSSTRLVPGAKKFGNCGYKDIDPVRLGPHTYDLF